MAEVHVTLSNNLKEFVDAQVAAGGYSSIGDYLTALLQEARKRKGREEIEKLGLEGLATPAREMTKADWQRLHGNIDRMGSNRSAS